MNEWRLDMVDWLNIGPSRLHLLVNRSKFVRFTEKDWDRFNRYWDSLPGGYFCDNERLEAACSRHIGLWVMNRVMK